MQEEKMVNENFVYQYFYIPEFTTRNSSIYNLN